MMVLGIVAAVGVAVGLFVCLSGVPVASFAGRVALFVLAAVMALSLIVQLSHLRRGSAVAVRKALPSPAKPVLSADGHLAFPPALSKAGDPGDRA